MDHLVELRKKAEAAVADMPDEALRTKAFEVILGHLLSEAAQGSPGAATPHSPGVSKGKKALEAGLGTRGLPVSSPDRILTLKSEGFFEGGRGIREIRDELQAHGWMYRLNAISGPLMKLVRQRQLRRAQFNDGKKKVFKYFNP
jgi:hypothetical protein